MGALRVGISGTPGAGKSTFIETLGRHLIRSGQRIAVLAVDPSSRRSGGSILGDKTRMAELARSERAFVRPSPTGTTAGGIARRTREAALLCAAAGFDLVLIETVGVGQNEVAVADMVDCFILLLAPGGGDELQGIKRGVVELADLIVVNKADGDLERAAERAKTAYRSALQLLAPPSPDWTREVLLCSALEDRGLDDVLDAIRRRRAALEASGALGRKRADQSRAWLHQELESGMIDLLRRDATVAELLDRLDRAVADGSLPPPAAAREILRAFLRQSGHHPGSGQFGR
jgi:LAO/AO transport system kinase